MTKGEKLASCSVTTHHPYEFTIFFDDAKLHITL